MFIRLNRVLLLLIASRGAILAQSETATLRGTIADSRGTPLSKIFLTVTDSDAKTVVREVISGAGGTYEVPYLRPGVYNLSIDDNNYQRFEADGIYLDPAQVRVYDIKLIAEKRSETTEVHETAQPIPSQTGIIGQAVDTKSDWNDSPVADRRITALPLLVTAPTVEGNHTGLVISGVSSRDQQTWAIDGIPHDTISQTGNPLFFETIEVTVANPGVDSSRPVNFNMVSKHGGDSLHGQVYYKHGSSALSATPYMSTEDAKYRLRDVGGELGGAIIHNWTYFYAGGGYMKLPEHRTLYADVPTAQMRTGDFSQYLNASTAPNGKVVIIRDPKTGVPFPNNQIPSNRFSNVLTNYLSNYYPSPNVGDANTFSQNYSWDQPFAQDAYVGNWPFGRLDQKISNQSQLYFRWLQNQAALVAPGSVGEALSSTQNVRLRGFAIAGVQAFTPALTNRISFFHNGVRVKQGESEGKFNPTQGSSAVTTIGLQGVNPNAYSVMGFPTVSIAGMSGLSMAYGGGYSNNIAQNDTTTGFEDSITWAHGRHSVKAGVQATHYGWIQGAVPQSVYGSFDFTGTFTGLGFADFLIGAPATTTRTYVSVNRQLHQNQAGAFVADSFRVSRRLTLDYGVRWDYYGTPVYNDGYMANWDPTTGKVIVAPGTLTAVSTYYPKSITVTTGDVTPKAKTTNFRPRIGAAYRLTENTILRGGYGEYTQNEGYGPNGSTLSSTNPFNLTETYTNSFSSGLAALVFPKPFPSSPSTTLIASQSVTATPMQTEEGVIHQFNATLEREVRGFALRVAYIGARGTSMNYTLDTNKPQASTIAFTASRKPYSQFVSTYVTRTDGEWHYDSALLQVQRRAGPVIFTSSFTLANNIANYLNTYDPYNVTNKWTRDADDRRLYFVTSVRWPIPVGKGHRLLSTAGPTANRVLGDWTLQAISTVASGQYFSPLFTGADPANASAGYVTQLADCVGDPKAGAGTLGEWFNPAAFAIPSASSGRYGTCGMNSLEGYPIHVAHVSLAKRIPLGEVLSAAFTAEVSNVTNTAHFTVPNNNISNANAGAFTASSLASDYAERMGYRQVDLKLRLQW
jgi:Carboxypeptidase regulatory-like domain